MDSIHSSYGHLTITGVQLIKLLLEWVILVQILLSYTLDLGILALCKESSSNIARLLDHNHADSFHLLLIIQHSNS